MSDADLAAYFDFQPTPTNALPDPGPLVENLARCVVEALLGVREVEQIARWVNEQTYLHLTRRAIAARRARALRKQQVHAVAIHIGTVAICHAADGVVEATVVVRSPGRTRAVALRLEGLDGRWRATAIHVL